MYANRVTCCGTSKIYNSSGFKDNHV